MMPAVERVESAQPAFLTAVDVAAMLQVDVKTVYRWASTDATMPAVRIGGAVRFDRVKLLAWLEARTQGSRAHQRHIRSVASQNLAS
jgi:excisionase family DNA binding protein